MGNLARNPSSKEAPADDVIITEIELQSLSLPSNHEESVVYENEGPTVSMAKWLSRSLFHKHELHRVLERPHLTAIAFSGTIGMGIFVTSGEQIGISGSLGCLISWVSGGLIIIPVMRCLAKMVSVRPVSGALMDYPHTYLDEALGFAVGATYWLSQCLSMAALTAAAARDADYFFKDDGVSREGMTFIIVGLYLLTLISNLCGVKLYGNLERVVFWFKICLLIGVCLLMILVKAGIGGSQQPATFNGTANGLTARSEDGYGGNNAIVPFLKFDGFNGTKDLVDGGYTTGIPGSLGQFLAIWTSITTSMFSCIGGDIVLVCAGEARTPRKDLPPVARFMYLVPIGFYVIASFLVGLNINFMDPGLYHPWVKPSVEGPFVSGSPFIIILSHTSIQVLPKFLNACFLISAYTAANTGLYISSRTLFAISHLYGNKWMKATFGRTSNGNTPVAAILFCSLFSFLAFLGFRDPSLNQPIQSLGTFFTGAVGCVYATECVAYLRFKAGLTQMAQNGLDRDSEEFQERYYRAHWQPLCAIFGLFSCTMVVLFSGWSAIYLLMARDTLSTADILKDPGSLVGDVVGAYSGPLLFFILFFGYKILYGTKFQRIRDFEGKYIMPEFDEPRRRRRSIWREILSFFSVIKS